MKTLILAIVSFACALSVEAKSNDKTCTLISINEPEWKKSETGTWLGASKALYKLNAKDVSLWMSKDGKTWEEDKEGTWKDKEGKWLKVSEKKLMQSEDRGKTWSDVPNGKWQGADGKWYKFDSAWKLWVA